MEDTVKALSIRTLAVLASVGLIVGAVAVGPAGAVKKEKGKAFSCAPATAPVPTEGTSSNAADAAKVPVVNVTSAATEAKPLTFEFALESAAHDPMFHTRIKESTVYHAFQVVSKKPGTGLYTKLTWPGAESDIDFYMYDSSGTMVATSGAFNPLPLDTGVAHDFSAGGNGGTGFESIPGFPAAPCSPYTFESKAFLTPGETATLSVWLGKAGNSYSKP